MFKAALFAPVLLVVPFVNYVIDPSDVFHAGAYERQVAQLMLDGWNVPNYAVHDERLTEKLYIDGMRTRHEVAVFGSSRMFQLVADEFAPSFFNHAMSGATVRDFVAIYSMLRAQRMLPSTLVLGLDPWALSVRGAEDVRWEPMWREFADLVGEMGLANVDVRRPWPTAKLRELVSLSYFQTSLSAAREWPLARHRVITGTHDRYGVGAVKRRDGSIGYDEGMRSRGSAASSVSAADFVANSGYAVLAFSTVDPDTAALLRALVQLMRRDGVHVVLWRSPVHPLVYASFKNDPKKKRGIDAFEAYTADLARIASATVIGSFDPGELGWDANEFYDGVHPTERAIETLTRQLAVSVSNQASVQ